MWIEAFPFLTINAIKAFHSLEKVQNRAFFFSSDILGDKSEECIVTILAELIRYKARLRKNQPTHVRLILIVIIREQEALRFAAAA